MPDTIQFVAGHQNYYTYDASGKKLEVQNITSRNILNLPQDTITRLTSSTKLTTDYCGDIIYQNDSLKEILTPEGYWQNGVYYYYLKDHQGNTRIVLNQNNVQVEISHYYPDGMRFTPESSTNSAALPYRYNGKELEAMNGLNEYDYGARRRETGIPVWTTVDPLAEKYYGVSPYAYCAGNPVRFIDSKGKYIDIWYPDKNGNLACFRFNENNGNQAPDNTYVQDFLTAYNYDISNGGGDNLKEAATNQDLSINVSPAWVGSDKIDYYSVNENTVHWEPHRALQSVGGLKLSPATILEHEMDHAVAANIDVNAFIKRVNTPSEYYGNKEEQRVMQGSERKTAYHNKEVV